MFGLTLGVGTVVEPGHCSPGTKIPEVDKAGPDDRLEIILDEEPEGKEPEAEEPEGEEPDGRESEGEEPEGKTDENEGNICGNVELMFAQGDDKNLVKTFIISWS